MTKQEEQQIQTMIAQFLRPLLARIDNLEKQNRKMKTEIASVRAEAKRKR